MTNQESKSENARFSLFHKLKNLENIQEYPEFKDLLMMALQYVFTHENGFEMFTSMVVEHINQTGDDDLFFELENYREELHDYLKKR